MCHQVLYQGAVVSLVAQLGYLIIRQRGPFPEPDASVLGPLDAVHLTLGADFGLELADSPKHVEEEPPGGIGRVDVLIEDDKIDALLAQVLGNLAKMERGPGQPVDAGDDQLITFTDIVQAVLELGPCICGTTALLLKKLVAGPELLDLDIQGLSDGTDACVSDFCHGSRINQEIVRTIY